MFSQIKPNCVLIFLRECNSSQSFQVQHFVTGLVLAPLSCCGLGATFPDNLEILSSSAAAAAAGTAAASRSFDKLNSVGALKLRVSTQSEQK